MLTAVHHHKLILAKEKRTHDIIVAATQENWAIIKAHIERMVTIFEMIIREGNEAGEFKVEDPHKRRVQSRSAFIPFFRPILIEHRLQHGEDAEAGLREQIRFILKALGIRKAYQRRPAVRQCARRARRSQRGRPAVWLKNRRPSELA